MNNTIARVYYIIIKGFFDCLPENKKMNNKNKNRVGGTRILSWSWQQDVSGCGVARQIA
jgi:hypothetical protein